jgi:hypothetical protein
VKRGWPTRAVACLIQYILFAMIGAIFMGNGNSLLTIFFALLGLIFVVLCGVLYIGDYLKHIEEKMK